MSISYALMKPGVVGKWTLNKDQNPVFEVVSGHNSEEKWLGVLAEPNDGKCLAGLL